MRDVEFAEFPSLANANSGLLNEVGASAVFYGRHYFCSISVISRILYFLVEQELTGCCYKGLAFVAIHHWVNCYTGWLQSQLAPYHGGATARGLRNATVASQHI